jgi:hypothetical protein
MLLSKQRDHHRSSSEDDGTFPVSSHADSLDSGCLPARYKLANRLKPLERFLTVPRTTIIAMKVMKKRPMTTNPNFQENTLIVRASGTVLPSAVSLAFGEDWDSLTTFGAVCLAI